MDKCFNNRVFLVLTMKENYFYKMKRLLSLAVFMMLPSLWQYAGAQETTGTELEAGTIYSLEHGKVYKFKNGKTVTEL